MLGKWHAARIESSAGNGIPDVDYGMRDMQGKLELKYIKAWPKRDTTKVKLPLRSEQRHFFVNRGRLSGNVYCLCRVEDDFFLLDWSDAVNLATSGHTRDYWYRHYHHWYAKVDFNQLAELLLGRKTT